MSPNSPLSLFPGIPSAGRSVALARTRSRLRSGSSKQDRQSRSEVLENASEPNRVLMLGSVRELALYQAEVLHLHGFHAQIATNREQALDLIRLAEYDVVVVSYTLPDAVVRELSAEMRECGPQCPVIAIANTRLPDRTINPDKMILADEGPAALINALRQVLRGQ